MTDFEAIQILDGIDPIEYPGQDVDALQQLVNSGTVWHLQGHYVDMAGRAIECGDCVPAEDN